MGKFFAVIVRYLLSHPEVAQEVIAVVKGVTSAVEAAKAAK